MFKMLKKCLRKSSKANRRERRSQLSIEALEARELLSVSPLLPNPGLVTNAVSTASAPGGTIYALEGNGSLYNATTNALISNGVQSFAIDNSGQDLYWLTTAGVLNESINGGASVYGSKYGLFGGVESFALADGGQAVVYQMTGGVLQESQFGNWSVTLATSGLQSFAVGAGGQDVYWLTTSGVLNQSTANGGASVYGSKYGLFGGVESFALADGGQAVVYQMTGGVLQESQFGNWSVTLATSGVQSFTPTQNGIVFQLNPATLSAGTVGQIDSWSISVPGSSIPFDYTLASGTLPTGLFLSSAGVLSGMSTEPGTYAFTVQATSSSSDLIGTQFFILSVAAISTNDSIWSGYEASPGSGVTAVGGTWVEPTVTGVGSTSIWVGIDGYDGTTVEQLGVSTSGAPTDTVYTPWIEFYGDQQGTNGAKGPDYYPQTIPGFAVNPGDTISAEVSLVAGTSNEFQFQMTDKPGSGGKVETCSILQTMQHVVPAKSTAEWIVENPNNGTQPLADFGQVNFTGAWATVNGITGGVNSQKNLSALNISWSLSSGEGQDVTSNLPGLTNTLGYNEPASGVSCSSFNVTWLRGSNLDGAPVGLTTLNADAGQERQMATDVLSTPSETTMQTRSTTNDATMYFNVNSVALPVKSIGAEVPAPSHLESGKHLRGTAAKTSDVFSLESENLDDSLDVDRFGAKL